MQNSKRYQVKAGRFQYDIETKKAKVSKAKGQLSIFTNEEYETHVSWINLDTKVQQIDLIVFPFDTTFQSVSGQKNTFVMRFQSNQERLFFWLQEKIDSQEFVNKVNQRIAYIPDDQAMEPEPEKMEVEEPQKKEEKKTDNLLNQDFITRLTNNLMAAKKKEEESSITHLSKVLTPDVINTFLTELTEEDKAEMLQYLPDEQKGAEHIASNVRSPQFQQAFDVLSDALNSQNVLPLFMQMGLDQKFLKSHYGVHAFLIAMHEKNKQKEQEKKE